MRAEREFHFSVLDEDVGVMVHGFSQIGDVVHEGHRRNEPGKV